MAHPFAKQQECCSAHPYYSGRDQLSFMGLKHVIIFLQVQNLWVDIRKPFNINSFSITITFDGLKTTAR